MNPQNRVDLRLNRKQKELFDTHLWLIWRVVKRFGARCPENHLDDMLQECRIALARKAATYKGNNFGAVAWLRVRDTARDFLGGRRQFGNAAMRNAAALEYSLDDVIGREEGEDRTRLDRIEAAQADRDYQQGCAQRHKENNLAEIEQTLNQLPDAEHRVIVLHFLKGFTREAIAKKMKVSVPTITRWQRQGIRALRQGHRDKEASYR